MHWNKHGWHHPCCCAAATLMLQALLKWIHSYKHTTTDVTGVTDVRPLPLCCCNCDAAGAAEVDPQPQATPAQMQQM
jgi:hypothetical protein